jgi:ribosomal protein S18 acetylase RimI-like enzyme
LKTAPCSARPGDTAPAFHLQLRPATAADQPFLFELYASTRAQELAQVAWEPAQCDTFLRSQFAAQSHSYHSNYPGASFEIIEIDGRPAGRLYLHPREKEMRVIDIALLPAYRGQGVGTHLLHTIVAAADRQGKSVSIHVEMYNPAMSLYERLGFKIVSTYGLYHLMEHAPVLPSLGRDNRSDLSR